MTEVKRKFMAATSMMLVATMMLGAVTYAWFTLSSNPEITGMKMNLIANQNLEIALDNGYATSAAVDTYSTNAGVQGGVQGSISANPYTWGNTVNLATAMTAVSANSQFIPVNYNSATSNVYSKLEYAQYGADGRINGKTALTPTVISDHADVTDGDLAGGFRKYTQGAAANANAYNMAFWVRSNETTKLTVTKDAQYLADDGANAANTVGNTMGSGSYIRVKVANGKDVDRTINYLENFVIRLDKVASTVNTATNVVSVTTPDTPTVADTMYLAFKIDDISFTEADGTTSIATKAEAIAEDDAVYIKLPLYSSTTTTLGRTDRSDINNQTTTVVQDKYFDLTANQAAMIVASMYLDGATITNADALLCDVSDMELSIQFQSSAIESSATYTTDVNPDQDAHSGNVMNSAIYNP